MIFLLIKFTFYVLIDYSNDRFSNRDSISVLIFSYFLTIYFLVLWTDFTIGSFILNYFEFYFVRISFQLQMHYHGSKY